MPVFTLLGYIFLPVCWRYCFKDWTVESLQLIYIESSITWYSCIENQKFLENIFSMIKFYGIPQVFWLTRSSGSQGLSITGMGGRWWVGERERQGPACGRPCLAYVVRIRRRLFGLKIRRFDFCKPWRSRLSLISGPSALAVWVW